MGRDNPFENAARGRDASGINEDELRTTEIDWAEESPDEFVGRIISTNDIGSVREILAGILTQQNKELRHRDRALLFLADEVRRVCQRDHVCSHREIARNCFAKEGAGVGQCNYSKADWIVENALTRTEGE